MDRTGQRQLPRRAVRPDNTTFYLASIKAHDDAYVYAAQTVWNVNNVTGGVEFYDHGALREILVRDGR